MNYFLSIFLNHALAQGAGPAPSTWAKVGSLNQYIGRILDYAFGAVGAIFVIIFIIGGIYYLTSLGNEEGATKAKKLLLDAIIGIIIVVGAWAITSWILEGIGGSVNWGK